MKELMFAVSTARLMLETARMVYSSIVEYTDQAGVVVL